jgi:hypothetical protein
MRENTRCPDSGKNGKSLSADISLLGKAIIDTIWLRWGKHLSFLLQDTIFAWNSRFRRIASHTYGSLWTYLWVRIPESTKDSTLESIHSGEMKIFTVCKIVEEISQCSRGSIQSSIYVYRWKKENSHAWFWGDSKSDQTFRGKELHNQTKSFCILSISRGLTGISAGVIILETKETEKNQSHVATSCGSNI